MNNISNHLVNLDMIVKLRFGSHLYGTATHESDLDIKGVYIPLARDILLQRVQPAIVNVRNKRAGEKNTAQDTDFEAYSPYKFLSLLAEGQTVALDMIFAPSQFFIEEPSSIWEEIHALAPKLFNRKSASFIRYCRQQANKYGIKGSRIASVRHAESILKQALKVHPSSTKLSMLKEELKLLTLEYEFLNEGELGGIHDTVTEYFDICGKKVLYTVSIKSAYEIVKRLLDEYGERALAAERNKNIDWKALSHAVRVGHEAIEFLKFNHITFPRPEAEHLLAIKQGKLAFSMVAEEIERLLIEVEEASLTSTLPDRCDPEIIDDFIEQLYRQQIIKGE